jgi:hypothetical protein
MTSRTVHLGFEVGSTRLGHGIPVLIPIRHMAVTGQTQESGKTTALEALITRSGLAAIAFLTKRGEASFTSAHQIKPFFQERADWQFVESILESAMKQRMKFERAWIVKACRGAKTLADVQANVRRLEGQSKRSMDQDLYMLLGEYLDKVVPLIQSLPKSPNVVISDGLNVMDLRSYPEELQSLVISSTLDHIHKTAQGVITVIPEAWKFIPQGRNTPVHMVAEKLIREGAGLKNYVWIDSQDMAGVDKVLLRGCPVWLIGVQREANELKRALANMPAMLKKPKAEQVATLQLGQFYACFGSEIRKTFIQPAWMDEKTASAIAAGRLDVHSVQPPHTPTPRKPEQVRQRPVASPAGSEASALHSPAGGTGSSGALDRSTSWAMPVYPRPGQPQSFAQEEEMPINPQTLKSLEMAIKDGAKDTALQLLHSLSGNNSSGTSANLPGAVIAGADTSDASPAREYTLEETFGNESLYQAFKKRLTEEAPGILLSLTKPIPEIEVREVREKFTMDTTTREGRVAWLIADGYFDVNRVNAEVVTELAERGFPTSAPNVAHAFAALTEKGFLVAGGKGRYRAVAGMKVNIVKGHAA